MTLPEVAFFPHTLLPLYIFEPRYREMLRDVLAGDRLFAVVGLNPEAVGTGSGEEPPYPVASAGMIRMCHANGDGTSHLILQGLRRVRVTRILREHPYRIIAIEPLACAPGAPATRLAALRTQLLATLRERDRLGCRVPEEMLDLLEKLEDFDACVDLAAFTVCPCPQRKQQLLETLVASRRCALLVDTLRRDNDRLRLGRRLQGDLPDAHVPRN